jgi:hypothetical protein
VFQYQKFNSMIAEGRTPASKEGALPFNSRGQGEEGHRIINIRLCVRHWMEAGRYGDFEAVIVLVIVYVNDCTMYAIVN